MAVTRIKADKRWFRRAAARVKDDCPRLARELERAADRPGKTAELQAYEARVLVQHMPLDERARTALERLEVSEANERRRPRGYGIHREAR